jgi:acyl dehydratase
VTEKAISYEDLTPGYAFPPASYKLDASLVTRYLRAVGGAGDGVVPPLAITALAIATMAQSIPLPPGMVAIHASQELEFFKAVPVGSAVECHIRVAQKMARGKMTMLIIQLEVFDGGKEKVQSGRATVALLS